MYHEGVRTRSSNESPTVDAILDSLFQRHHRQGPEADGLLLPLKHLFDRFKELYMNLKSPAEHLGAPSRRAIVKAQLHHSKLIEEIKKLRQAGIMAQFDGKSQHQIILEIQLLWKEILEWDYNNTCWRMIHGVDNKWDFATSPLFIILPSDLDTWDDTDPSTHQFRLYFMCDIDLDATLPKDLPRHVHISNHPGYPLSRPKEFFQDMETTCFEC